MHDYPKPRLSNYFRHAALAFLARRRALRPSEEYRVPTDEEWAEFLGHIERRKVSIGTCGRATGCRVSTKMLVSVAHCYEQIPTSDPA